MNCTQLEEVLPEIMDQVEAGGGTPEQMAHLADCTPCASLWADLRFLSEQAATLHGTISEDQSPAHSDALWLGIKMQLEAEGVIRPQGQSRSTVVPFPQPVVRTGFSARWLMPLAATLLLGGGAYWASLANNGNGASSVAQISSPRLTAQDNVLLQQVAKRSPEKQAHYKKHLEQVNEYIASAQRTVAENPNDQFADETLRDAYSQKAMVYDIAYTETEQ